MPKYYVQSGKLQLVLQAKDSRSAAIWAAHRTLSQSLPFVDEPADDHSQATNEVHATNEVQADNYAQTADLTRLGPTMEVSQQGFAGGDRVVYETLDVVLEWNRLLIALDRMQQRLLAAATARHESEMTAV